MGVVRAIGGGRKAFTNENKELRGTLNKSREKAKGRGNPPKFEGKIERQGYLSERAVEHWDRLTAILEPARVIQAGDVTALALLCEELATWEQMNKMVAAAGPVHLEKDDDGKLVGSKVSALYRVRRQAYEGAMKGLALFGLTPADRSRVYGDISGDKPKNIYAEFA